MKLRALREMGLALPGEGDCEITGVTSDSRKVAEGTIFVAIKGAAADGADFIAQAVASGACAIVAHDGADLAGVGIPAVKVGDPRPWLSRIAAALHPRQPERMVAVTGTAGKTSVASFMRQIWAMEGKPAAMIGTTGVVAPGRNSYGSLTTPDPGDLHRLLDELAGEGVTHAAMEASSHGLDQYRLHGVRLSAAGFTNIGRDHMDYHPTVEHYFNAKMRLFTELLPEGGPAVIFADDAWSARAVEAARNAGREPLTVGHQGEFLTLTRVEHERFRQVVEIRHDKTHYRVEFPLAGEFQVSNALVAAGMAIATGSDPAAVMKALEKLKGAPGRLELVGRSASNAPCYVDYAHKPEALENVLSSLRPFTTGRIICVFGCGGDRDPGKRPIMGEIASRLADIAIVTDDNPRSEDPASIRAAIMAAAPGATEIGDRHEAIAGAYAMLREGDCLVVAGKGHEVGQIINGVNHHFSDHEELARAIKADGGRLETPGMVA